MKKLIDIITNIGALFAAFIILALVIGIGLILVGLVWNGALKIWNFIL